MSVKPCRWTTRASLTALLAVGSCLGAGDFCEVVRTDRPAAEALDAQNSYGREFCPAWGT